ncbi:cytoplasmic RNA-binding protein [Perkinsela sp. CCAP 1560/4]|nr:cytoplasmic RNA-binding protein [Perkinsela sp. CCAP 1560/4]|eukprot:KNH08448.1 cytoplasmic RNA-binding protein [Perkinsela sp. CCAP 1560/4]
MYTKYIELLDNDIISLQNQLKEKRQLRNHLYQKEGAKVLPKPVTSPLSATSELPFTISPTLRAANVSEKMHVLQSNALPFIPSFLQAESAGKTQIQNITAADSCIDDTHDDQVARNDRDRRSICILGVDQTTLKFELKRIFEAYGQIERITIMTQQRHCTAYIQYFEIESVEKAVSDRQLFILKGNRLTVSRKRTNIPGFTRNSPAESLGNFTPFQEPYVPLQPTLQMPSHGAFLQSLW